MSRFRTPYLLGFCALLVLLWLPGIKYPVVSDSANYGLLGQSLWEHGTFKLLGVTHGKFLPLYPFFAYPFTRILGFHLGMHSASLAAGWLLLIVTYLFSQRILSDAKFKNADWLAASVTAAVLIHPSFVLLSMGGSSDLLFATLFVASLYFYLLASDNQRWYILAGVAAGLTCLTRYNGLPLFPLFLGHAMWERYRKAHLTGSARSARVVRRQECLLPVYESIPRSPWFWSGMLLGGFLFSLWLLRNALVFGNPLHTEYSGELQTQAPHPVMQFFSNIRYYVNPIHNLFPYFFLTALVGLWNHAKKFPFLLLAILAAALLSSIWWVQAIRFLFPAFVLLFIFAILGLRDALAWSRRSSFSWLLITVIIGAGIGVQSLSLCLYTYGACNAAFDRTVGVLPRNLGLTPEGFYAWHQAREEVNRIAEPNAFVRYSLPEVAAGIFRADLKISNDPNDCPAYTIMQHPEEGMNVRYVTKDAPETAVVKESCIATTL